MSLGSISTARDRNARCLNNPKHEALQILSRSGTTKIDPGCIDINTPSTVITSDTATASLRWYIGHIGFRMAWLSPTFLDVPLSFTAKAFPSQMSKSFSSVFRRAIMPWFGRDTPLGNFEVHSLHSLKAPRSSLGRTRHQSGFFFKRLHPQDSASFFTSCPRWCRTCFQT